MADKDYSVKIGVGVEIDEAALASSKKKLESFQKAVEKALFNGESMKFAVGGYSMESFESLLVDELRGGNKGAKATRKLEQIAEDFGDAFVGVIDIVEEKELDAKRELNQLAQRYAKMIGVEFVSEFAKSLNVPDFMLPAPEGSKIRNQTIQDFVPGKDGSIVVSPAMFVDAIERAIQGNPNLQFGKGAARGLDAGLTRGALNQGAFQSAIPEISDDIKESIFDLMDRATQGGKAEAVGSYIQKKAQEVLDRIFEIGYNAREGTFRSAGVTEGEDSADNLIRYADASARQAIAKAEEEFGLAVGTLARHIQTAGSQYFNFDAATTVGDGNRVPSDPNILRQVVRGDYNDPFTGTLMSMGSEAPDLMAQIFNNPAIIASGKEGVQGLMEDLGKFIKPDAASDFDVEAYKSGLAQQKAEVEAAGGRFMLAFDTEFNQKLPQLITEASLVIKDALGNFREVTGFVQAPPASQYGLMAEGGRQSGGVAAGSFNELARRAQALGLSADIGATDFDTNFKQFYAKMAKLSGVLGIAAELDIPVVGSNIQGADYDKLFKSITYINDKIVELGLELPKLQYPIDQALVDTKKVVTDAAKAKSPTAMALTSESMPGLKGAGVENLIRNLVTQFPAALGENLQRIELKPGGGFKIDGLDAHFAKADNQAVLIITEAMSKFEDLVAFMQTKIATDYQPKKVADKQMAVAAGAAGGGGGLDARRTGGEDAENARKRFLTEKELLPLLKELTQLEQQQVMVGLDRLGQTKEYKALIETERVIRQNILELEQKLKAATTKEEKRTALKELIAEKSLLEDLVVAGKRLETQKRDEIKLSIRGKDVKDKDLQTTSKQIDEMNRLRSTTSGVGREIIGQLKEQAAATKAVETQTKSLVNTWVTGRYALYDVGNAYAGVARQLWMASRQIFNVTQAYRSYETAFTSVERAIEPLAASLAGAEVESRSLKNAFVELSEQIPVSFEDISRIATLGAQMGVAASGIVDFTKTVAQFSAVTGVAADTVAQKFGRIAELANVDYSEFNNLGSAILYAGINAVATEPEIMTLSESIAAVSAQAGMAPEEIIGMATALASTGIQAEQARGVFTRVFADIDRVVSTGGEGLAGFASVAGMSASEFQQAWGTEGASYDVFRAILGGLGATSDLTAAFDKLNIVETREINTLTRLANNLNVVDQAIGDANQSFASGTFLGDSFQKTVDNLDSQIQMFNNNVKSLAEALSGNMAGGLTVVIGVANEFLQILKEVSKNPLAGTLIPASLALTVLGAGATLAVSGMAKLVAQIYAFRVAAINTANDSTAVSGITSMLKQLTGFGGGIIEMRDSLKTIDPAARGVITPTTFKMFDDLDKRKKTLLETDNIYLAGLKGRGQAAVEAARIEADSVTQIVAARNQQLAQIELLDGASAEEKAQMAAAIGGRKIYIETINGETRALTANEIAELKNTAASNTVSAAKRQEAAERLKNVTAIDTETRAASMAPKGVLGLGSRLVGLATGLGAILAVGTTLATTFAMIAAASERMKVNVLESGGGVASLRDAIKQDTQAYQALSQEQKAASTDYSVLTVKTATYSNKVNENAVQIRNLTGASSDFVAANQDVIEGVEETTLALGSNTRAWLANALMQDENLTAALDKYPTLFADLKAMGYDFQEIIQGIMTDPDYDPFPNLDKQIADLNSQFIKLQDAAVASMDPEESAGLRAQAQEIDKQLVKLNLMKDTFDSIREALGIAVAKNEIFNAINAAFGIAENTENAILALQQAFSDASKSGEGMKEVMAQVRSATVGMLKDIDGIDPEIIAQVNDADTVAALINIVKALYETEKAANLAASAVSKAGSSVMWGAAAKSVGDILNAGKAGDLSEILRSLQAIAVAGAVTTPESEGNKETVAERLNRLVKESFAAVDAMMAVRSAAQGLGKTLSESKSWSSLTEGGRSNLQALQGVISSIGERAKGNFGKATTELQILRIALQDAGFTTANAGAAFAMIDKTILALGGNANLTSKQIAALRKQFPSIFKEINAGLTADVKKNPMFKTITEYAQGIATAMKSALEFRYQKSSSFDAISQAWLDIRESADSAAKAMNDANATIKELNADKSILDYRIKIADKYGDTKRAALLRAQLEKTNKDITDATNQRDEAQSEASKSLTGNTKAAIRNRGTVRGLVQTYTDYLASLAGTGMSTADLKKEAAKLAGEFLTQGKNMGFAESELKSYTAAFESDFKTIADKMDQFRGDITLAVNTDPALRAISEFVLSANEELAKIVSVEPGAGSTPAAPTPTPDPNPTPTLPPRTTIGTDGVMRYRALKGENLAAIGEKFGVTYGAIASANPKFFDPKDPNYKAGYQGGNYLYSNTLVRIPKIPGKADGGLITGFGTGTSDSLPHMLSNGEFVMKASSVRAYGVGFFNALNQQRVGFSPVTSSARQQQGGPQLVYLSPEDRNLLRAVADKPVNLYTENAVIARSANEGNQILAQRGLK